MAHRAIDDQPAIAEIDPERERAAEPGVEAQPHPPAARGRGLLRERGSVRPDPDGHLGPRLDALALGESEAGHLGVDVPWLSRTVSALFALLTAVAVATAGVIAFVALMVPSLVRGWIGQSHRQVVLGSALLGATSMVVADVLARSLFSPVELSIGVLTTIVGAPFFLWLLLRERGLLAR